MKDRILSQRLRRVAIAFAVSERIVISWKKKCKVTKKKPIFLTCTSLADSVFCYCHLKTPFS